ncbi:endopeptidase La [Clostridium boliviensis]|uniref:Lon protease n=1 Tax=Clostridium boliviensis TaxID=318465 RepID=A0ABU4GID2_9CLOT|nr:endopeptidase La [Clostridium boliviensis]MDW2796792.1 endopeptidase La [Clostridium boliviensis]
MKNYNDNQLGIIVPVFNKVLLPGVATIIHLEHLNESQIRSLSEEEIVKIALPLKQDSTIRERLEEDFHRIGVTFSINSVEQTEKGVRLSVELGGRILVNQISEEKGVFYASFEETPDFADLDESSLKEMLGYIKKVSNDISSKFTGGEQYQRIVNGFHDINRLIMYLSQFIQISPEERYQLLEIQSLKERSLRFMDHMLKQKEMIELQMQVTEKFSERANKNYREAVLREQLKAIQEELNEGKEDGKKENDFRTRIEEAGMPDDIKESALEEYEKMEEQGPNQPDYKVMRNYLDLLVKLPWKKQPAKSVDLDGARKILNERHYGLDKVKDRIIQHLAVMELNKEKKGSILLLVGPPGTGKTSLGKSIAEALDRPYARLSLGGVRDESEIRGHRRTYVGAMPGRIIQSMKKAGSTNPVMVLDEVDKLMAGGYSGDPASALLEVLDPEQNNTFTDHYLDVPYDLSDVFFIATANSLETIPGPLLDRMEVISITSYTADEKFHIGKDHLIPEVLKEHGLTFKDLVIADEVLRAVINDYTMEAGVRGLKKQLSSLARTAAEKIVSKKAETPVDIKTKDLEELLGRKVSRHEKAQQDNPPGVVTGLAWTPVGGEILFIEAADMPGSGNIILTGKLGDVMKESARISLSLLKSRLPMSTFNFKERDLHIHVPSGAVPKDGPSAGIALFTALASLVTGAKVDSRLAMTGEITLRGAVLPIGGLKEKLLGAQRAGIKKVLIPQDNVIDLKEVPEETKEGLTIITVETIEDVIRETVGIALPRMEQVLLQSEGAGRLFETIEPKKNNIRREVI